MLLDYFIRFLRVGIARKHIPQNVVLCDLGCGPEAYLLNLLKKNLKRGIGIDKKAKEEKIGNLEIINFNIQKRVPLPDQSVDYLTMLAALEHFIYPREVLRECWRVLKNGGYLIITIPAPISDLFLNFMAYKLKIIDKTEVSDHKYYFSLLQLKNILIQEGFEMIKAKKFEFGFNIFILARKTNTI